MMDYQCLRVFRSRDRRMENTRPVFLCSEPERMSVPTLSRAVFRFRAPLWRSFLLTIKSCQTGFLRGLKIPCYRWRCLQWLREVQWVFQPRWKWKQLAIHWWLLLRKNKCLSSDISAQYAENHMCRKGTWSATGSNITNGMMALVSLVHSVIRNLPCLMICILIRTVFIWR